MPVSHSRLRLTRQRLGRSTALGGAAVVALLFAAPAAAQEQCGAPAGGQVACTSAGGPYDNGVSYPNGPDVPGDLTIVVDDGVGISSSSDGVAGLLARNFTGGVSITGAGSTVATTGNGAVGVYAQAMGDVALALGDVSTQGYGARGVVAQSITGGVTLSVDSIETAKTGAGGLFVIAQGPADVDIGSIHTVGTGAVGAEAHAGAVDLTVTGTIATEGDGAVGIRTSASAGSNVIHNNGAVTTSGIAATGIYAAATQGYVRVDGTGTVATQGAGANGIDARSTDGTLAISVSGDVSTSGADAIGINARVARSPYFFYQADATVEAGNVSTTGDRATGIYAYDNTGNMGVTVHGKVTTSGYGAEGIRAIGAIYATVDAQQVATGGDHAAAVYAYAGSRATLNLHGAVSTRGDYSAGAIASSSRVARVVNDGGVTTSGDHSVGILAYAQVTAGVIGAGSVTTTGKYSAGIVAIADTQTIVVSHDITTSGYASDGVASYSYFLGYAYAYGHIRTTGDRAHGINAHVGGNYIASKYQFGGANYGAISTSGHYSTGVYVRSAGSLKFGNTGGITTSGGEANGVEIFAAIDANFTNAGTIQTSGILSNGVDATAAFGHLQMIQGGTVTTTGDRSAGLALSAGGGITLTGRGTVHTSGAYADGIAATALDLSAYAGKSWLEYGHGDAVSLTTGVVVTDGTHSRGIVVRGRDGALALDADTVRTAGTGSTGIDISGNGDIAIKALSVATSGSNAGGILAASAKGGVSVSVTDVAATGGNSDAIALTAALDAQVDVAAGGTVSGARNGIAVTLKGGKATITNAGTLAGGAGNAITVAGGAASVTNQGVVRGAVHFGSSADSFANAGTFAASGVSDFGAGTDSFVNTGTLTLAPAAAGLGVTELRNLESFANQGGTIDLRNGHAGDQLLIGGDYLASGAAQLRLEVARNTTNGQLAADQLAIAGAASGSTTILLTNLNANTATLIAQPLTLVTVGAGSTADAFTLAPQSSALGFVQYSLGYDAASRSYQLASAPGAPLYRLARSNLAAETIWLHGADAATGHARELRDAAWGSGSRAQSGLWADFQAGSDKQGGGYRQDSYTAQLGYDLLGSLSEKGGTVFGLSGGYASSKLHQSGDTLNFDSAQGGLYAAFGSGRFFATAEAQYARHWIRATSTSLGYADRFDGSTWGATGELGYRLGTARFFVEPVASLAWTRTDLGKLEAFGQTVDFDNATGLRGKAGARIGGRVPLGGATAVFYASGNIVHEFAGSDGLTFVSGGTQATVATPDLGSWGQARLGLDVFGKGPISGFVEGNLDFAGSASGGGGRIGLRLNF